MTDATHDPPERKPESRKVAKISRGALQVAGGAVPFAGGVLSAIAGAWSEAEQERVNLVIDNTRGGDEQ